MNQFSTLLEYLERLKVAILDALSKIENSSYYDRLLNRFEGLEARQQKWIVSGSRLALILLVTYFLLSPLLGLFGAKGKINEQRLLLADMKHFNERVETQPRPAPPPRDWQPLAASTAEEASNSLKSYMASIGFPDGSYQFLTSSNAHLQVDIPELNLRQAQAILYQVDGWYPQVSSQILSMKVHPDDDQKLTMSLTLAHRGGGFQAPDSETGGRRSIPRNRDETPSPEDDNVPFKIPGESTPNGFDAAIPTERPRNPTLDEYPPDVGTADEGLPDFESLESNEALDSLPPPPPMDDEFGDSE